MAVEKQGFPDDRDRELLRQAGLLSAAADDLLDWASSFANERKASDFAILPDQEFELYRLRRFASNLLKSVRVPVAAAVYGASQTGKSLFVGRILEPADALDSPLGNSDQFDPPAYIRQLSFQNDINPQSGSNEATALVTRFTTKERFDSQALTRYPVKVQALTRAEWLRVLARGFRSECKQPDTTWNEGPVRKLFETVSEQHAANSVDRDWRIDLLDAYAHLQQSDPRIYEIKETMFNSFLSTYPLDHAGYVEIAAQMFWDGKNFPGLTDLFINVCRFLNEIKAHGRDGILVDWAAVRFLLDSQRSLQHDSPESKWEKQIAWTDIASHFQDGWYVLEYKKRKPGESAAGPPREELAIIQAAMLEMIIPVIPQRLKDDWRNVILRMDVLDLPGMRAGGGDGKGGMTTVTKIDEIMNVVKRGKVFYLVERYIEERQVQTLLLLVRGGNLEVRKLLKDYIDKWGQTRYGQKWPKEADRNSPALLIGMTGIDDEFEKRALNHSLYNTRLNQLVNETLFDVMTDFGGANQPFTNIFPIRYPGTWDSDEQRRSKEPQKWQQVREIFLQSEMVRTYVRNPEERWDVAMLDNDGGLSLISKGWIDCTTSLQKQDSLQADINKVQQELRNLAASWYCNPDANRDREKRTESANSVMQWLADEQLVYERVRAIKSALTFDSGDAMEIAEAFEIRTPRSRSRPEKLEDRFPLFLREFLDRWARDLVPQRWSTHISDNTVGAPWLSLDQVSAFSRYLCDYLCGAEVFEELSQSMLSVITMRIHDESDRWHSRREYVRVILNDYVLNPGPDQLPLEAVPSTNNHDYGLMASFISRWQSRLASALGSAAGAHKQIPAGNDELQALLS